MDNFAITEVLHSSAMVGALIAGPPLLLATLAAFMVAIFQTLTSIQDQTLSQTVKVVCISIIVYLMFTQIASLIMDLTIEIFVSIDNMRPQGG